MALIRRQVKAVFSGFSWSQKGVQRWNKLKINLESIGLYYAFISAKQVDYTISLLNLELRGEKLALEISQIRCYTNKAL